MVSHQCLSVTLQAEKQNSDGNKKTHTHTQIDSKRGKHVTQKYKDVFLVDRTYLELFHLNGFWQYLLF